MSFFGLFSSAPKVVDNVFDKDKGLITQLGEFIGNQKFTTEESAELNVGIVKSVNKHVEATLDENTERSKARREISVNWFKLITFLILVICMVAPIDKELAIFYLGILTSGLIVSVTTAITIFFFGSYGITRIKQAKKND
tara:strand:- start:80 stop:499 length:420 start_codon:yes stop_codon:yes gene_type:complete